MTKFKAYDAGYAEALFLFLMSSMVLVLALVLVLVTHITHNGCFYYCKAMTYYKVKDSYDQVFTGKTTLIAGELYTEKEMKNKNVPSKCVIPVHIKKGTTFVWFGARYSINN